MNAPNLAWHIAAAAIEDRLEVLRTSLETCEPTQLTRIQGEIAGLSYALNLPTSLPRDPSKSIGDDGNAYT